MKRLKIFEDKKKNRSNRSSYLCKDMLDQPFLCVIDMLKQRGFVHAHSLRRFTGGNPPGVIKISPVTGFQLNLFLLGSQDKPELSSM